ncbi:MAG: DUF3102 domain-containing protein [Methylocella sp.]
MNENQGLRVSATEWAARINAAWQKTVSNIIETGQALIDAKADLPHGTFTNMIEDDLAFGPRAAERLMAIASHPALSNPTHASVLPASWTTLAELARLDGFRVETLIKEGRIYPGLERKDVALLLPPPKAKVKAKTVAPADAVIVEPAAPLVEEAPEPQHMLVRPDDTPPIVHVDPPAPGDFMIKHLREELAARDEEIEDLKSSVAGFITLVQEKDREIVELKAARAGLEDRVRRMKIDAVKTEDQVAEFLIDEVCQNDEEKVAQMLHVLENYTCEEIAEAIQRAQPAKQQPVQPVETSALTAWDQFVETYRATETPLPENHPKLIAGMVNWADENGFDIEQLAGAPQEANEIWFATAKNFRGQTCAGNLQRENTVRILQRFGDERRHSVAAMASSLNVKEKFLAGVLDMMLRADFKNMISREQNGKDVMWKIRRPAK